MIGEQIRIRAFGAIGHFWAVLLDWRPLSLIGLAIVLILATAQAPIKYAINVGLERGPLSDRPFLQSFYPTEGEWPDGLFRWSRTEYATIALPGLGRRAAIVELNIASHRSQRDPSLPPTPLTLRSEGSATPASFALRREGAHYHVLFPATAASNGALRIQLDTPAWQSPGDSRDSIGIALAKQVRISTLRPSGLVLPDLGLIWGFPLGLLVLWGSVRLAGFSPARSLQLLLPVALFLPLIALIDPFRHGFLGPWLPAFGLLALGATAAALLAIPPALRLAGAPSTPTVLHWLVLLVAATFALKYGGRFYPEAMPGDWQLHINRFTITGLGDLAIQAKHRGLPFPFPPGYYIDIAPLTLLVPIRPLLPFLAGVFEAASLPVIYALAARLMRSPQVGLWAAVIYGITAHGFMNTWFSFHTQVSTQFFTALLALILCAAWPRYHDPRIWWPVVFLLLQQFLGHIGTFINAGLLGIIAVVALWVQARTSEERRAAQSLLWAGVAAAGFALLFYYSTFMALIIQQVVGVATVGLVEVSGKKPLDPWIHLQVVWEGGLITHYGFFPVLLALAGGLVISRRWRGALPVLVWGTLAVSTAQAILPLLNQSAIMTRWLTFAAWAVAIAAAIGLRYWQRSGRAARWAAYAMIGYAAWITAVIFVEAMTQRLPPIEPF